MGKLTMFMVFMFIIVNIAGGVMTGELDFARTHLTVAIDDDDTTITVASTEGFPTPGIIDIGGERIAYSSITTTTFRGNPARPLLRGVGGTTAIAHSINAQVATPQGAMMNTAMNYNTAVIADSTGAMAFVSTPIAVLTLIGSFLFLPLQFLGTDLQILTVFWAVIGIGMIISFAMATIGGRRVG